MNKLTILFLTLLIVGLPMSVKAESSIKEKRDDTRYLAGAVPEVNGKVIFSKEFQIPGKKQQEVYQTVLNWMNQRLKKNNNPESRVVFTDPKEGIIAGIGEEWLTFRSTALILDRSLMNYQLTIDCNDNNCVVNLEKIRFTYRETEKYKAEEWITDKVSLNKSKTKLIKAMAKWRRHTVDFADNLFYDVAVAFGATDNRPAAIQKQQEAVKPTASLATGNGPVVIGGADNATAIKVADKGNRTYTATQLTQIPSEAYMLMDQCKVVVSIGEDEFNMTNMIAKQGGALGKQNGKAVAYFTLAADQAHEVVDKAETYTLKLIKPGEKKPAAIIECKKQAAPANNDNQPRTYVGEIIRLTLVK